MHFTLNTTRAAALVVWWVFKWRFTFVCEDLYTSAFKYLHRRDLYLMVKVLHANAVMLEPWDAKDSLTSLQLKGPKITGNA